MPPLLRQRWYYITLLLKSQGVFAKKYRFFKQNFKKEDSRFARVFPTFYLLSGINNRVELLGNERSSTDKTAVHVGLCQKLSGILLVHRATVLNGN